MKPDHKMKTHTKLILGLAAAAAVATGFAAATEAGKRGHHGGWQQHQAMFDRFDTDNDGKITKTKST